MIESFAFCVRHIQDFFFFSCRLAGANLLITFGLNFRWFNWTTFELFSRYEVTHTSFIPPEWQHEKAFFTFWFREHVSETLPAVFWSALTFGIDTTTPQRSMQGKSRSSVYGWPSKPSSFFSSSSPHRLSENESGCQMKALSRAALGRTKINK